jgi:hypothetical protein
VQRVLDGGLLRRGDRGPRAVVGIEVEVRGAVGRRRAAVVLRKNLGELGPRDVGDLLGNRAVDGVVVLLECLGIGGIV